MSHIPILRTMLVFRRDREVAGWWSRARIGWLRLGGVWAVSRESGYEVIQVCYTPYFTRRIVAFAIDWFTFGDFFLLAKNLDGFDISHLTKVRAWPSALKSTYKRLTRLSVIWVFTLTTEIKLPSLWDMSLFLTNLCQPSLPF